MVESNLIEVKLTSMWVLVHPRQKSIELGPNPNWNKQLIDSWLCQLWQVQHLKWEMLHKFPHK
jgi:hypothetical protein